MGHRGSRWGGGSWWHASAGWHVSSGNGYGYRPYGGGYGGGYRGGMGAAGRVRAYADQPEVIAEPAEHETVRKYAVWSATFADRLSPGQRDLGEFCQWIQTTEKKEFARREQGVDLASDVMNAIAGKDSGAGWFDGKKKVSHVDSPAAQEALLRALNATALDPRRMAEFRDVWEDASRAPRREREGEIANAMSGLVAKWGDYEPRRYSVKAEAVGDDHISKIAKGSVEHTLLHSTGQLFNGKADDEQVITKAVEYLKTKGVDTTSLEAQLKDKKNISLNQDNSEALRHAIVSAVNANAEGKDAKTTQDINNILVSEIGRVTDIKIAAVTEPPRPPAPMPGVDTPVSAGR